MTVVLLAGAFAVPLANSISRSHAAGASKVLILSTTVTNGTNSLEAQAAQALGLSVTVVDPSTWASMTSADFASYKAIVLGDPTCVSDTSPIAPAEANTSVWGSAIKGNVVVIGTDPVFHVTYGNQSGAGTLISNGIAFATSTPGKTGAYIDLSCYYAFASSGTAVPVLDGIASGGFTAVGQESSSTGCPNNSHIVGTSPVLTNLTDASLSNWGCSTHEGIVTWPSNFQVQVISEDIPSSFVAPDGTTGAPYILTRGSTMSVTLPPPATKCAQSSPAPASAFRFPLADGFGRYFTFKELYPSYFRVVAWRGTYHPGVDYYSTLNAPVYAVANGMVVRRQVDNTGYGSYVVIQHVLPDGEMVYSLYAHLSNFRPAPEVGCPVTKGQVIGYEGASGEGSGGIVHVHFELRLPSGVDPWNTFLYPVGGTDPLHNINNFLDPDTFIAAHAGSVC